MSVKRRSRPEPTGPQYRITSVDPLVTDGSRTVRFCFSDDSVDRMGDSIKADGWQTSDFLKNPVALWAHDSSSPPIGRASNLTVENGNRLMGDIEFASAAVYLFAETVFQLVKNGFVKAVSVGFIPIEYKWVDSKERPFGMDFLKQELLEISVVPVPANANALIDARAKGIDVSPVYEWAERVLDGGEKLLVPRSEIERLRKAASELVSMKRSKVLRDADGDGMGETDPSAGGAVVGSCGRSVDDECGMKNPMECSIHGQTKSEEDDPEMDEKAVAAVVRREFKALSRGLLAEVKSVISSIRRENDDGDGDNAGHGAGNGDGDDMGDEVKHLAHMKTAHFHIKEASKSIKKAIDAVDGDDPSDVEPPADSNPEGEEKAAERRRIAAALRAAV